METETLIECRQLVAAIHGSRRSADCLDFSAQAGTIISIIGPDHAGKSDWLKTIAGVEPPVSGELQLLEKNTDDFSRPDWVRARTSIAYIHTDTALLSAANALQNIMLPAAYHGLADGPELKIKALRLLNEVTENCDFEILPAYLRKDQRIRIAIARALILEPKALLLDKPFSLLDLATARKLQRYLLDRVSNDGLMLMMVTHDIKFALRHSNQILFMTSEAIHHFNGAEELKNCEIAEVNQFMESAT